MFIQLNSLFSKNEEATIKPKEIAGLQLLSSLSLTFSNRIQFKEIPRSIKPKTRPYTLEVIVFCQPHSLIYQLDFFSMLKFKKILYWGLRNLKEYGYIMFGQKKLCVRIEIGDKVLESNIIENLAPNVNFTLTHRKHSIVRTLLPKLLNRKLS